MPGYPWLYADTLDTSHAEGKVITLRRLGVPYPAGYEQQAEADLRVQAQTIADRLTRGGMGAPADREIIALIAYMQRLGTDIKAPSTVTTSTTPAAPSGVPADARSAKTGAR